MNDPTPPAAPDPVATAKAQGDMNTNTAITQQLINQTNQVTPNGNLTYSQTGNNTFTGADGKQYTVPQFTATQTLTPEQQQLLDLTNATKKNLGQIGVDQSAKIGSLLGTNLVLNTATENKIDQLGAARLDPQWARNEDALRTRLSNQGIKPGSEAWNAEMTQFNQNKNDAYDSLYLSGRSQGAQEALTERNQPINEISALLSGSQVSQPNYVSTPTANVAGVDYTGAVQNNFQNQMGIYNSQMAQDNAVMGGLFGLAGTAATAGIKYSDRRLKSNVVAVGRLPNGLTVYDYEIFGRPERGVMADEAEQLVPQAVSIDAATGFKMVDYSKVGAV